MYKIFIKYPSDKITNLWQVYGSSTTSTTGETVFTEFETNDDTILIDELVKLDSIYGFSNIKVTKEVDIDYNAIIV